MESSIGQKYRCLWRVDIFKYIEDEKWEMYRWKEKINEDVSSVDMSYKTHTHTSLHICVILYGNVKLF